MTKSRNEFLVLAVALLILSAIVVYQAFDSKPLFSEEMVDQTSSGNSVTVTKSSTTGGNQKNSAFGNNKNAQKLPMNLNTASLSDLCTVSGIGEIKGKAIIEYRQSVGSFSSVDELKNVKGIGDATFNKIKGAFVV